VDSQGGKEKAQHAVQSQVGSRGEGGAFGGIGIWKS